VKKPRKEKTSVKKLEKIFEEEKKKANDNLGYQEEDELMI